MAEGKRNAVCEEDTFRHKGYQALGDAKLFSGGQARRSATLLLVWLERTHRRGAGRAAVDE